MVGAVPEVGIWYPHTLRTPAYDLLRPLEPVYEVPFVRRPEDDRRVPLGLIEFPAGVWVDLSCLIASVGPGLFNIVGHEVSVNFLVDFPIYNQAEIAKYYKETAK